MPHLAHSSSSVHQFSEGNGRFIRVGQRTFAEILEEKLTGGTPPPKPATEGKRAKIRLETVLPWWNLQSAPPHPRTPRPDAYPRTHEQTHEQTKGKTTSEPVSNTPPTSRNQWSFEQQLALDQLIRMGASIRLDSPYADVKKAYKKLIRKFHPDQHQNSSPALQKRMTEQLRAVIEAFSLFEKLNI
mgnify:CR=1 FL=1